MSHDPNPFVIQHLHGPTLRPALGSTSSVHIFRSSLREMDSTSKDECVSVCCLRARKSTRDSQAISRCYSGFYCYCVCLDQLLHFGNGITPYLWASNRSLSGWSFPPPFCCWSTECCTRDDTNFGQFM